MTGPPRCGDCAEQPAESLQPGSGVAIALGTVLDAIPEAMVLGIGLRGPATATAVGAAVAIAAGTASGFGLLLLVDVTTR